MSVFTLFIESRPMLRSADCSTILKLAVKLGYDDMVVVVDDQPVLSWDPDEKRWL